MRVPSSSVRRKPPLRPLRRNCHCSLVRRAAAASHGGHVVVVDEVGAVAAAALHELGRRSGEHALAPLPEDARPVGEEERDVEDPRAVLVGILEAHVLVEVFGIRRSHALALYERATTVARDVGRRGDHAPPLRSPGPPRPARADARRPVARAGRVPPPRPEPDGGPAARRRRSRPRRGVRSRPATTPTATSAAWRGRRLRGRPPRRVPAVPALRQQRPRPVLVLLLHRPHAAGALAARDRDQPAPGRRLPRRHGAVVHLHRHRLRPVVAPAARSASTSRTSTCRPARSTCS